MRKLILAAAMAATVLPSVAMADPPYWAPAYGQRDHDRGDRDHRDDGDRHDRSDWNNHDRGDWRNHGDQRVDWREARRYDWNRPDVRYGGGYDASRYYRDGRYYQERRLTRYDRVYRGNDGRYYCRRSDGTTGLILGALGGGLLGNAIANGHSSTLGTLIGVAAGGAIGSSIDRGNMRCR